MYIEIPETRRVDVPEVPGYKVVAVGRLPEVGETYRYYSCVNALGWRPMKTFTGVYVSPHAFRYAIYKRIPRKRFILEETGEVRIPRVDEYFIGSFSGRPIKCTFFYGIPLPILSIREETF